jgi:hypothetical protein
MKRKSMQYGADTTCDAPARLKIVSPIPGVKTMRFSILAAAVGMAAIGVISQPAAAAVKYPYCAQGDTNTGCWYKTLAQCRAATSDIGKDCVVNPKLDFARQTKAKKAFLLN